MFKTAPQRRWWLGSLSAVILALSACGEDSLEKEKRASAQKYYRSTNSIMAPNEALVEFESVAHNGAEVLSNATRNPYFGDLHVHTTLSFDASAFGTTATARDAYRYAQGEPIEHPSGFEVQLAQPLDFYAVTDHGVLLGLINEAADTNSSFSTYSLSEPYHNINDSVDGGIFDLANRSLFFSNFISDVIASLMDETISEAEINSISQSAWQDTIEAANEAYQPGKFTTFVGYEYTSSTEEREALHRNVIFRGSERFPAQPFSRFNSINPEGLWHWMDRMRERGVESLAIPHNSNGSNGAMFAYNDFAGNRVDPEYTALRSRNEPLVEITQVKGTSDTHPLLSKNDEWANFEIFPLRTSTRIPSDPNGSYVRDALKRGLELQSEGLGNPYDFGLVGASDTHTAAASLEEDNYVGKIGAFDSDAEKRGSTPASFLYGTLVKLAAPEMVEQVDGTDYLDFAGYKYWGASGIAGVWAESNTRESIYDAMRRKETFATSGTRITVRFFAGYGLDDVSLSSPDLLPDAYSLASPMGGSVELEADKNPTFLVWAQADPSAARLQRIQIIKGWLEDGEHRERVYDVACSDGLDVDPESHRCPDNGARVNLSDCSITKNVGSPELRTLWKDPDSLPQQDAFYYVRVLENPVCRWSTWDALRAGVAPRSDLPKTIQERAWSSPIWVSSNSKQAFFEQ